MFTVMQNVSFILEVSGEHEEKFHHLSFPHPLSFLSPSHSTLCSSVRAAEVKTRLSLRCAGCDAFRLTVSTLIPPPPPQNGDKPASLSTIYSRSVLHYKSCSLVQKERAQRGHGEQQKIPEDAEDEQQSTNKHLILSVSQ